MSNDKHVHVCEECWKSYVKINGRCAGHEHCGKKTYCCKNVKVSKSLNILPKTFNEKEYIEQHANNSKTVKVAVCPSCGEDCFLDHAPDPLASHGLCLCGRSIAVADFKEVEIANVISEKVPNKV